MRYKPHIKNISAEANVMFSLNKASAWLESKNTEEMNKLLKNAYKNVAKTRAMYKERKDEITRQKHANLQETLRKAQEARQRKAAENLLQTNDILFWDYGSLSSKWTPC